MLKQNESGLDLKTKTLTVIFALMFLSFSCGQKQIKNNDKPNIMSKYSIELIHESSPYLLQHAHNPVNWYPWGDEALKKARDENKILVISIGYAACHWCHVMENESYEDATVARIMNEHFVSIKVDREERPDIDQLYMNAAYLITGNADGHLTYWHCPMANHSMPEPISPKITG